MFDQACMLVCLFQDDLSTVVDRHNWLAHSERMAITTQKGQWLLALGLRSLSRGHKEQGVVSAPTVGTEVGLCE